VTAEASWTDPAQNDEAIAWAREVWDAMEPYTTGAVYLNFPGLGEEKDDLARAGYGENYDRLVALKTEHDPDNLFRMNINIPPAG
jgi:FAD/FMN-containing dehydrogenase